MPAAAREAGTGPASASVSDLWPPGLGDDELRLWKPLRLGSSLSQKPQEAKSCSRVTGHFTTSSEFAPCPQACGPPSPGRRQAETEALPRAHTSFHSGFLGTVADRGSLGSLA